MKRYIIKIWFILAIQITYGQCTDCKKNISTHPNLPINNCWNAGGDNAYKNKFDWRKKIFTDFDDWELNPAMPWSNQSSNYKMASPFSINGTINGEFSYINLNNHPNPSMQNFDFNPEDGWELLKYEMGYFPNLNSLHLPNSNNAPFATAPQPLDLQFVPHVMLYNKYRGVVRVFFNVLRDNITQFNGIRVRLSFADADNNKGASGVFRHLEGYDRPLNEKTNVSFLEAIVPPTSGKADWSSADFQLGYDPCVCHLPSNLKLEFFLESKSNLVLSARTIELPNENMFVTNGTNTQFKYGNDYLTNFSFQDKLNSTQSSAGSVIYKSMDKKLDEYSTALTNYNYDLLNYNNDKTNASVLKYLSLGAKGASTFMKPLKIVGEVMGYAHDFYSSQITKPSAVTMPTVSLSATEMKGSLETTSLISSKPFYQPGSYPQAFSPLPPTSYNNIPIYNEPLGLFALKKLPEFKIQLLKNHIRSVLYEDDWRTSVGEAIWCGTGYHQKYKIWDTVKYIPAITVENLDYMLNPSADIDVEKTTIKVAYEWAFENNESNFVIPNRTKLGDKTFYIKEWDDDQFSRSFSSVRNAEIKFGIGLFNDRNRSNFTITSTFLPYEANMQDRASKSEFFLSKYTHFQTETKNVCLTYVSPTGVYKSANFWDKNSILKRENFANPVKLKKIDMKVLVNFVFKTKGINSLQNETQQLFTYNLYNDGISPSINTNSVIPFANNGFNNTAKFLDLETTISNIQYLNNFLTTLTSSNSNNQNTGIFNNKIFDKKASIKIDNANKIVHIYCTNIDLKGSGRLVKMTGDQFRYIFYTLNENAANIEIAVFEGELDNVKDEDLFVYPRTNYTPTQSLTFQDCKNSNVYNANKLTLKAAQMLENDKLIDSPSFNLFDIKIYPNPAISYLSITLTNYQNTSANIKIFDLMGREMLEVVEKDITSREHSVDLDIERLAPGTYIVKVNNGLDEKTTKLVVVRY